jgi:neutral ceramidase
LVLDAEQRVCLVSLDSQNMRPYVSRPAAKRIAAATGIPQVNILICATHSHRAPSMNDFVGAKPDAEFLRRLEEGSVLAAVKAVAAMDNAKAATQSTVMFGRSQEATVGRNSRLLLKDGMIGWDGYEERDVVRPTGPYDPDLYVLALRRADGKYGGLAFNHSVHNNCHIRNDCMSPCFYGLAALEVERRHGAATLFLPGAFGSTHNATYNNSGVPAAECVHRVVDAIEEALGRLQPALPGPVQVLNRPFTYHVRRFDEVKEALAVKSYLEKYAPQRAASQSEWFRKMREEMAPHQGEARQTRLQIIRLGDIVFVGIPGEMFARLGLELRRRSPFRHTCIIGLANEQISYIPDRQAYADGGYQTWVGWHSMLEVGTGEAMVNQVVAMLNELYDAAPLQRRRAS